MHSFLSSSSLHSLVEFFRAQRCFALAVLLLRERPAVLRHRSASATCAGRCDDRCSDRSTLLPSSFSCSCSCMKTAHASIHLVCSVHKSAHRRPIRPAVQLRRGDLAFTPPPWHQTYKATAEQLHTPDMIKVLDSQECSNCDVDVAVDISPVGAGYFVSGGASADLPLQCDCCLATFRHPVAAPFEVWLDASLPEHAIPEDPCQLPFPPEMPAVDLGPTINDALHIALPGANLCGRPDCSIQFAEAGGPGEKAGWSATPKASRKSKSKSSTTGGSFAALQKLKNTAKN